MQNLHLNKSASYHRAIESERQAAGLAKLKTCDKLCNMKYHGD